MDRDFQKQRMLHAAWRVKRCPAREKDGNKAACLDAIKMFLDGVARDAGKPVGEGKRRSES
jgi:hypothetical protein